MFESFLEDIDQYQEALNGEQRELAIVRELEEQTRSSSPDSIRMQTLESLLYSADAMELAIKMNADDQLWEENINRYGELMPAYKESTKRKKRAMGFPEDKLQNYTYYMTGRFRNQGIGVDVNLARGEFDFVKTNRLPYFQYLQRDAVGLTEENIVIFKEVIGSWLIEELDRWMMEKLEEYGINPAKYGYF